MGVGSGVALCTPLAIDRFARRESRPSPDSPRRLLLRIQGAERGHAL